MTILTNPCSVCGLNQYIKVRLNSDKESYLECTNCDNTSTLVKSEEAVKQWNQENPIA